MLKRQLVLCITQSKPNLHSVYFVYLLSMRRWIWLNFISLGSAVRGGRINITYYITLK